MRNWCLALTLTLAWSVLPSWGMRCSRIDVLVLEGSGVLLHDGTVLAINGKPLQIGCYCGNHPNTRVSWLRHNYKGDSIPVNHHFGTSTQTRMAIEGGHSNQSVFVLHLDAVTVSNSGVYVCRDQCGFMQRTLKIQQLDDGLRSFLGEAGPEPSYFLSKLNFLNDTAILAGAMDHLYLLDAELQPKRNLTWLPYKENAQRCESIIHDRPHYTCRNHIRFYHPVPDNQSSTAPKSLVVCGTGAFYPNCTIMEDIDKFELDPVQRYVPNYGIVLQHPDLTGYQQFRNLYPGDPILLSAQHRKAYMESYGFAFHNIQVSNTSVGHHIESMDPSVDVLEGKIHWMRAPVAFVDGYAENYDENDSERLNFFFMFFHENAFEIRVGDSRIYSRVARICKNDEGFQDGRSVVFDSYVKARIACLEESNYKDVTNPGAVDYYYNVIRKVKLVHSSSFAPKSGRTERIVYGAFTGDRLGPGGSAICVYNASKGHQRENNNGIFDIFKRDYLDVNYQNTLYRRTISNLNPFDCSRDNRRTAEKAKSENLIYAMIQQIGDFPLVKLNDVTVISMEVDQTLVWRNGELTMQDVIFVGTDTGEIRKIFVVPFHEKPFYKAETVETLTLEPHSFVHHLELKTRSNMASLPEKMLFANTNSSLYRLPLHRCSRLTDCNECVSAMDPYCFWSVSQKACVPLPSPTDPSAVDLTDYLQDVDTGDYTRFPQCNEKDPPVQCVDKRDCDDVYLDAYCSVRGLEHLPAPIHFFTGKMKQLIIPSFKDSWTLFSIFQHRKENSNPIVVYLGENRRNGFINLEARLYPLDHQIRINYSTTDGTFTAKRMAVQDYDRLHGNKYNCLALSYEAKMGTFTVHFNHESMELFNVTADFNYELQGQRKRILTLGAGPSKTNSLTGKVSTFLYTPSVLPQKEVHSTCTFLLEQSPLGGVCQATPTEQ